MTKEKIILTFDTFSDAHMWTGTVNGMKLIFDINFNSTQFSKIGQSQ